MTLPSISISRLHHRGSDCLGLHFEYDAGIKDHLMQLEGMRWSRTHRCFYIADKPEGLHALMRHCRGRIWLDLNGLQPAGKKERQHQSASRAPKPEAGQLGPVRSTKPPRLQQPLSAEVRSKVEVMRAWMEQQRYSRSTIKTYVSFLYQFWANHPNLGWNEITRDLVRNYNHQQFIEKKKSYSTQNQWINAIKLYLQVHELNVGDLEDIERPRREYRLPNVLSLEEVTAIIKHTTNLKHRTLLMLLYSAGLRIGEALRLKVHDIRSDEGLIYVNRSKGKKDRRVPLSERMLTELRHYYTVYQPRNYLFQGQGGGPYTARSAARVLQRSAARAGISRKVTLHTLRHSYATHLTRRGVNVQYLQEILGHNSPKTTMLYTHLSGKDIKDVKSPLDDLEL